MTFDDEFQVVQKRYASVKPLIEALSPKRRLHIDGCVRYAHRLALHHHVDPVAAITVAWLHDLFREVSSDEILEMAVAEGMEPTDFETSYPKVLHGKVAAFYLRNQGLIMDPELLEAISKHTLADRDMSPLAMLLYITDALEETRDYVGVEDLRVFVETHDLEDSYKQVLKRQIIDMVAKDKVLATCTIDGYNQMEER